MSHFQGMRLRPETGPKAAGTLPCDSASAAVVANILAAARCTLPMIQQLLLRLSTFLLLLLTASMRYPAAAFEVPSMAGQAELILRINAVQNHVRFALLMEFGGWAVACHMLPHLHPRCGQGYCATDP